jgi:hypothetical protein
MANFGKRPINDAARYSTPSSGRPHPSFFYGGELRIDRRPYGKVERFIDSVGNVITLQLSTPGDPRAAETANRMRMEKRAEGWVEHAKCPLRHGIQNATPALTREFAKMPSALRDQCISDPKVMKRENGDLHALESCPHVEWLIAARRAEEAKQAAKRNAARVKAEKQAEEARELQAAQLEMVKEQIAERKARKKKPEGE